MPYHHSQTSFPLHLSTFLQSKLLSEILTYICMGLHFCTCYEHVCMHAWGKHTVKTHGLPCAGVHIRKIRVRPRQRSTAPVRKIHVVPHSYPQVSVRKNHEIPRKKVFRVMYVPYGENARVALCWRAHTCVPVRQPVAFYMYCIPCESTHNT